MTVPAELIASYILAKDGNRPHLLNAAFAGDARLEMIVKTQSIAFPANMQGREAIAQTLVCKFNQTYENIYTLCIGAPPASDAQAFSCDWLVAMSEKQGGGVRVGCGRYDWSFSGSPQRIEALVITIEAMEVLPSTALSSVMACVSGLSYPWSPKREALLAMDGLAGLNSIIDYLRTGA